MEIQVKIGEIYRHFKGGICKIISIATHSETEELLVIYEHNGKIWARPYDLFVSKVDKEKYPDEKQVYRFELINGN
ncbi:MAG: DUF1653 domain-containing protein [Clostridium sp.]|nr:DUF1653 domain-containing protein [Clostridium sp.]MCM1444287.1 DUF1653 domain-containing protein [Candidatus Amulumruptor caecigallinarius]